MASTNTQSPSEEPQTKTYKQQLDEAAIKAKTLQDDSSQGGMVHTVVEKGTGPVFPETLRIRDPDTLLTPLASVSLRPGSRPGSWAWAQGGHACSGRASDPRATRAASP